MKNILFVVIASLFSFVLLSSFNIFAQEDECGTEHISPEFTISTSGSLYKPHRTDLSDGSTSHPDARFNTIIVFVQYPDEEIEFGDWPIGEEPEYMHKLLAVEKNDVGNFWDRYDYDVERLSDYYQELSLGKFHVTGMVFHYILDKKRSEYNSIGEVNEEIYRKIHDEFQGDLSQFDLWRKLGNGNYKYEPDGFLDMIMVVRRYMPGGHAGFVPLDGGDFLIDSTNNIRVRAGFGSYSEEGSGLVIQGNTVSMLSFDRFFATAIHEYGHYLWGPHTPVGTLTSRGGLGLNDLFASPFEKIKLGYLNPQLVNFDSIDYSIGDISNRSSNDQILRVPISSNEYFLITNRRKHSKYDVAMLGDTTRLNTRLNTGELGKGVYIYHGKDGTHYPGNQDIECADGLWDWEIGTPQYPDWSTTQEVKNVIRSGLPTVINNDPNPTFDLTATLMSMVDDQSVRHLRSGPWFSLGKKHTSLYGTGTDKIYTNYPEWWTSRALYGDRFDAWNLGYNEIFSPYSNPNTKDWENNGTGIFIHYTGLNNDVAEFKIYKATDENTLNAILELTPPSKPQILRIDNHVNGTICNPKIVWRQNIEPDMIRSGEQEATWKRYNIYKSGNLNGMLNLPPDQQFYPENEYQLVATIDVNPNDLDASWIDPNVIVYNCGSGGLNPGIPYPVRYRVQAVDKYNTQSVLSDFRSAVGLKENSGTPIGDPEEMPYPGNFMPDEIPSTFSLHQNFPNPFNPTTNIQFDLPRDEFVTIKIYDMSGRELEILFNDFRTAGRYIVGYNASHLASGVYFYTIKAGSFEQTRRMILLK